MAVSVALEIGTLGRTAYYNVRHGDGQTKARPATDDVWGDDRLAHGGQSSVLRPTESVDGGPELRRLRRDDVPGFLRGQDGTAGIAAGPLFSVAVGRLLRGP